LVQKQGGDVFIRQVDAIRHLFWVISQDVRLKIERVPVRFRFYLLFLRKQPTPERKFLRKGFDWAITSSHVAPEVSELDVTVAMLAVQGDRNDVVEGCRHWMGVTESGLNALTAQLANPLITRKDYFTIHILGCLAT
jgi:hypothetical protein